MAKKTVHRNSLPPMEVASIATNSVVPTEANPQPMAASVTDTPSPSCKTCVHWLADPGDVNKSWGHCRRYPPSFMPPPLTKLQDLTPLGPRAIFHVTAATDLCGEYKPLS